MTLYRKAAHDLDKIPASELDWRAAIQKYGMQRRTLQDLCLEGKFSASTAPKEAFLTMRCFWPQKGKPEDAMEYIANLDTFFDEDHVKDAQKAMEEDLLGFSKLTTLYTIVCQDPNHQKTPPRFNGLLAERLGPFSVLVNLYNQLLDRPIQGHENEDDRLSRAPRKKNVYDPMQRRASESLSPTRQGMNIDEVDMDDNDIEMSDPTSSPPQRDPLFKPPALGHFPAAGPPAEADDGEPPRRTPTETLVVDFLVTLLGGIASLVQPLSNRPLCIANSFESTYTFGPLPNTSPRQGVVQYRARIDGSIPYGISSASPLREAAIFEAKRAVRKGNDGSKSVLAQQSMEHVAYIWNRHTNETKWRDADRKYHTFMVAQDHLSFYISIGTYDTRYLKYIFSQRPEWVLPKQGSAGFLEIQEFGPFETNTNDDMAEFSTIMLSFIFKQLENTSAEAMYKEELR